MLTLNISQDDIPPDLYDTSTSRYSDAELFRRSATGQPRTTFPWRTTLVALFLFGFGLTFLLIGILHFWQRDQGASIAFIVLGSIAFIPGSYVTFNLIQTLRGARGFHLSQCKCFHLITIAELLTKYAVKYISDFDIRTFLICSALISRSLGRL